MNTLSDSIAVLAVTTPPKKKLIVNVAKCNRRLRELEAQLGLPAGPDFYNIGKANARIKELEARFSQPAATAPQSVKTALATTPAASGDTISPSTLTALAKAVFGTDAETGLEAQRLQFTRAGLSVPGLAASPPNPNYTPNFTGLARVVRGVRQSKINAFFNPK